MRRSCITAYAIAGVVFLLLLLAFPMTARCSSQDGDIEWDGISHVPWQDRRPLCPVDNESFAVRFQAFKGDLTGARVFLDDGGATSWIAAAVTGERGPYYIWEATIPATAASGIGYYIELTDGADTDFVSVSGISDETPVDGGWRLDFATLGHAPLGATPIAGGTVFRVWAPGAATCHVRGDFNGWNLDDEMTRDGEYFALRVAGASAGQEYKYFFGPGDLWKPDARSRAFDSGSNMNSIIVDPFAYAWQEEDFRTPPKEEMIVYQLHVGQFAGRNDPLGSAPHPSRYVDVAARADHLAELGVNTVMVNPVTEFPGDYSGGYNPVTAWAPEWIFGSVDDFRYMVDELHRRGIAVLVDIVWNHFSVDDNYLWYYDGTQIYFDDPAVDTPWGSQADFDRAAVRAYFLDAAMHWLEECRIDGFRMDATSYMSIQPGGWSLMQELNDLVDNRYAGRVLVAEQLPDDAWITRPTGLGGAGFDAQYYDYFKNSIRSEILDAAFGDPEMWRIRDIVNGSGAYLNGGSVFNYLELHDEAWPMSGGQRIVKTIDTTFPHDDVYARGRVKLAQGIVTLAPGIPAFLRGLEWLEDADFGTGEAERIDWAKKVAYADHFAFFRDLLALRKNDSFRSDALRTVHHLDEAGNVIGFRRWDGIDDYVVVANFRNDDCTAYRIGMPAAGDWREVLNSQDPVYGGSGPVNGGTLSTEAVPLDGYAQSIVVDLPMMGLVVFRKGSAPTGAEEETVPAADRLEASFPNPFNPMTTIRFSLAASRHVSLRIYDVSGRLVRTLVDGTFPVGRHETRWDGRNDRGERVASGVYFSRLATASGAMTKRMVLLR